MTETEKYVMVRLCAKLIQYVGFNNDKEVDNLLQWVALSNNVKENNKVIRNLIVEYKHLNEKNNQTNEEVQRYKEVCQERDNFYEKQQELKHNIYIIEKEFNKAYKEEI